MIESCKSQGWDNSCRDTCDSRYSDECEASCYNVCTRYTYPFSKDKNGNIIDLDGKPRVVGGAIDLRVYETQYYLETGNISN